MKDETLELKDIPVGTLVTCKAVVDWAYQRFPLMITDVMVESCHCNSDSILAHEDQGRKKGIITKLKVLLRDWDFDITEITEAKKLQTVAEALEISASLSASKQIIWYCDSRELGRGVQQGDEVDFVPGKFLLIYI